MQKGTWSVLFACFLGAFIGALSALEISVRFAYGQYFWGVGALLGGCIAYLAVDFRQFCAGFARSFRESKSNIARAYHAIIGWQPDSLYWKAFRLLTAGFVSVLTTMIFTLSAPAWIPSLHNHNYNLPLILALAFVATLGSFILASVILQGQANYGRKQICELGMGMLKFGNPIALPFVIVWWIFRGLIWMTSGLIANWSSIKKFVATLLSEIRNFVIKVFVYVHSERRTLCFLDATLGATAGFFIGSAIAGAVIGAILGVINYEIVSTRWLKLVPAKARK